jgi:glutathione S-transferase
MKLYFSPLACSLATRIALYEAGADAQFVQIETKTKHTQDGVDFRTIHPLGLVPALEMDNGEILTENAAILQHVADRFPDAGLAPRDPLGRSRLHQWLCFIGTELHKALYIPLLDRNAPDAVKAYALAKAQSRLSWVARGLERRDYLLDRFSVADAYLVTVLNWSTVTPVPLDPWPAIGTYLKRVHARSAVARAMGEEQKLYAAARASS